MHKNVEREVKATISKKKDFFPVQPGLEKYLRQYSREKRIPVQYRDMKHYSYSMPLIDKQGNDTLWETVYYSELDAKEIYPGLTRIYALLKTDGDMTVMEHLAVDRIDYCSFGNSNPFRVKIINNFNDNYDYFYMKVADASRIYGLELEHILSPNRITYLTDQATLVEEHIAGIPGDQFIDTHLNSDDANQTRIAKEFVKFNERCLVKLLGDMRAYNFVVDITPDFDDIQYRIRAIDFDQQSYEGKKNLYLPQFFKENLAFVKLCMKYMTAETVFQYQREERTLIANRIKTSRYQLKDLLDIMVKDSISHPEKVDQLKRELSNHYQNNIFMKCHSMGELVKTSLRIVLEKTLERQKKMD